MSARQSNAADPRHAPRCGACQTVLDGETTWQCPACQADLHDAGILVRRSFRDRLRESIAVVVRKLRRRPVREVVCGRCRYRVHGLNELTCPECGSDLLAVGAARPRFRGGPLVIFSVTLLAWSALVFGTLVYLLSWVYYSHTIHYAPKDYWASVTGTIALGEVLMPADEQVKRDLLVIKVDGRVEGTFLEQFSVPAVPIEAVVEPYALRFRFDPEADTFTLHETPPDADEQLLAEGPVSAIDDNLIHDLLRRLDVEPTLPATRRQVAWVAQTLRRLPAFERERRPTKLGTLGRGPGAPVRSHERVGRATPKALVWQRDRLGQQVLGGIYGYGRFEYSHYGRPVDWFYPTVQWSGVAVWLLGVLLAARWAVGRTPRARL